MSRTIFVTWQQLIYKYFERGTEGPNKDLNRQATITRLATINSAIEALKTHRKPIELDDVLSLAGQLEAWALGMNV